MRFMDIIPINFLITAEHLTANLSHLCKVHALKKAYKGLTFDHGAQLQYTGPFSALIFPFRVTHGESSPTFVIR